MSHNHFKGKFEVELKYRLASKSAFLDVLGSIEHEVMLQDNIESDCYFDTKEQHLLTQNKSLCIREMEPSGYQVMDSEGDLNQIVAKQQISPMRTMLGVC